MSEPVKPSGNEDEYFARLEIDKKRALAEELHKKLAAEERARLKALHWMRCAKCGEELQTITFHSLQIDKCFSCGGIYLDDGELEKLAGGESKGAPFTKALFDIFRSNK